MALTKGILGKIQIDEEDKTYLSEDTFYPEAYCNIYLVDLQDLGRTNGVKYYRANIFVNLWTDSTKTTSLEAHPQGERFIQMNILESDLNYTTFYNFLKSLPEFDGFQDC